MHNEQSCPHSTIDDKGQINPRRMLANDGTGIHVLVTIRINLPSKKSSAAAAGEKKET